MPRQHELKLPTASPKQQQLGKLIWNSVRDYGKADFFTLGYSGRSIEEVVGLLHGAEIRTLCDVRSHAVSMYKPAFSKGNLREKLLEEGIGYEHLPHLGIPRDIRVKAVHSGNRDVLWDWYDLHVARAYIGLNLHRFFNAVEHPVAFMCSELDPHECHRHRLCMALEALGLHGFDL